jgi:predicted ester cyclase
VAVEEHEKLARQLFGEVMSEGRFGALDEIVHPATVERAREAVAQMRSSFPDARVTVSEIVSGDDGVAALLSVEATHQGEWCGIQPTGKPVAYKFCYFMRVADGRLLEPTGISDRLSVWEQLQPSRKQFYARWWASLAAALAVGVVIGRAAIS